MRAAAAVLEPNPFFDASYYLQMNPDIAATGLNPLAHYVTVGWREGRRPSPDFDPIYYLYANPDVAQSGSEPLRHYYRRGAREKRCTRTLLFDGGYYRREYPEIEDVKGSPLLHYFETGWREEKNPHPLFDTRYYLSHNPELREGDLSPLLHFVTRGWRDDANPHPLFDTAHYRSQLEDDLDPQLDPLTHYLTEGVALGLDPSPFFDTSYYLTHCPDILESGMNPLVHYLAHGSQEGRQPGRYFDPVYYRRTNPDVDEAGMDPLAHYAQIGFSEARRPSDRFDATAFDKPIPLRTLKAYHDASAKWMLRAFRDSGALLDFPVHETPLISVVLILHNRAELTFGCLQALRGEATSVDIEVLIVDNASSRETTDLLAQTRGAHVIRNEDNRHFIDGCNQAAAVARGRFLLFLNNDAQLLPGALAQAVATYQSDDRIGAVGGQIRLLDGRLQEAGSILWADGSADGYGRDADPHSGEYTFQRDVDYCSGAFLLTTRQLFDEVGGFDTRYRPAYYEDSDYCVTLRRRGYRIVYEPRAILVHYENGSSDSGAARELMQTNHGRFVEKHSAYLASAHRPRGLHVHARTAHSSGRLRILFADDRIPHPIDGSGFPRANDLANALSQLGHHLTLYPCARPRRESWPQTYRDLDRRIEIMDGDDSLSEHLAGRPDYYDLVIVSRIHNYREFLRQGCLAMLGHARLIFDSEAIFAIRDHHARALTDAGATIPDLEAAISVEVDQVRDADAVVSVSEAEAECFRKRRRDDVFVLGHSCGPVAASTPFEERDSILFVGSLVSEPTPNVDGLVWFVREVLPHLVERVSAELKVRIVGRNSPDIVSRLAHPNVAVVGPVDDLGPEYERARVFIAPIRYGAGMSHKTHEAAAAGVPTVSTSLLARQLDWHSDEELLVADTPEAFAGHCAALYTDPGLWKALQQRALRRVEEDCSPEGFERQLAEICEAVLRLPARERPLAEHDCPGAATAQVSVREQRP
jgi:GT2 family glycosyltransferase